METRVYKLNYAKIWRRKNLFNQLFLREGEVLIDERTNSLVVTASPVVLNKADALINSWDKRIPQVLIEAKILQITLDKNKFLGVDWQYKNPDKHSITIGASSLPTPTGATYIDAFKMGFWAVMIIRWPCAPWRSQVMLSLFQIRVSLL